MRPCARRHWPEEGRDLVARHFAEALQNSAGGGEDGAERACEVDSCSGEVEGTKFDDRWKAFAYWD